MTFNLWVIKYIVWVQCMNEEPGYSCECKDNFYGSGYDCFYFDPCWNKPCQHRNSTCYTVTDSVWVPALTIIWYIVNTSSNTLDKAIHDFQCLCDAPYVTKDKNSCQCPIGFTDLPKDPFESQFLTCEDIDECDVGNDCNSNAICSNTNGSYDCKCIAGFLGDGYECHDKV